MRDRIAALMWHTQVVNSGAPTSVAWNRTPEAFKIAGKDTCDVWLKQADAIIAALPSMVAPLVWEGNVAQNGMGGRYCIDWYDAGDLCTQLTFLSYGNPHSQKYIAGEIDVLGLKAAANAHHVAQIMSAFATPEAKL